MKICIHYQITDKPWGGGNSFLKYFNNYLMKNGVPLTYDINDSYDVLLVNAAHKAPGRYIDVDELKRIKRYGYANYKRFFCKAFKPIFYRSDGFRDDYAGIKSVSDDIQVDCLKICDYIIFQNRFCLEAGKRHGYSGSNYRIIHNGVDQDLFKLRNEFWDQKKNLKVLSVSWSDNPNKGFADIAEFSTLPNVESAFYGRWPKEVPPKDVDIHSPITHDELAKIYSKFDVLLHPARYDASPNSCFEAISCGLPIIYHRTSGIREVAGDCGIEHMEGDPQTTYGVVCKEYDNLVKRILSHRNYFSIARAADEYLEYFRSVLNGSKTG